MTSEKKDKLKWDVSNIFNRVTSENYRTLLDISRRQFLRERPGITLQPGDVVHESLERVRKSGMEILNTKHFYASCATQMRWLLVEHARKRRRRPTMTDIEEADDESNNVNDDSAALLLEIEDGINRLELIDVEAAKVCVLHYFGGHTNEDIANIMGISLPTVGRRLKFAKTWLSMELKYNTNKSSKESS